MTALKMLIVEDEVIVAMALRMKLVSKGFSVTGIVIRGEQVESAIAADMPDVVILDIFLKGTMNGIDVARMLNEKYRIPFLFTTGNSDTATRDKAISEHPIGYFLKPVDYDAVIRLLASLQKQNRASSS